MIEKLEYQENAKLDLRAAFDKINEIVDAINNIPPSQVNAIIVMSQEEAVELSSRVPNSIIVGKVNRASSPPVVGDILNDIRTQ